MSAMATTIMIVDDEPRNLDELDAMLRRSHYDVAAFPRGDLALAAAPQVMPDLALVDIRMPEMDGYEVCRRFRQDTRLKDIPVLLLSTLSEPRDKILAFKAGAVDHLPKPLSEAEVLARVQTHLSLRAHQFHLEDLAHQRTHDLIPVRVVDAIIGALTSARGKATDVTFAPRFDQIPMGATLASPDLLNRAIADLLVTAACCTPSGGQVKVTVSQGDSLVSIGIATQGKMLPPDDLNTFFDIGGQRTLHKGGADVGLRPALALRSLRLFDGTASARNGKVEGFVIEVQLPLAPAA